MIVPPARRTPFARIIAALDASSGDEHALAMAAELAARFGVDVAGLFIEDVNLLRFAALPMSRHLRLGTMSTQPLTTEDMERDMRALAARAAEELEVCANRCGVRSSFRIVRGMPLAELTAATVAEDLLVLGTVREMAGLPLRLGSPLHEAAYRAGRSILHARQRARPTRPLVVLRNGSALASRVLSAALELADPGRDLAVLLVGSPEETAQGNTMLESMLSGQGYRARVRGIRTLSPMDLVRILSEGQSDVVVVAADTPGLGGDGALEDVVLTAPCDVLVIR